MGRVAAVLRESNPFADFVRAFAPLASQAIDERRQQESWNKFSDTFVPQQPMDVQQVQTPVQPLQGQASLTTQPSMPVEQPQTTTTQANMPSKDPYKQLEYETGKEFATKLKALSGLNPQERQFAMRQLYQEREQLLSNARYDKFSQDMEGIMAEYNPADPVAAHKAKAKAIALGRRLKIDTGDVLKLFEEPKQNLQFAPDGTMFVNGRQASNQGQYRAPEKPSNTVQWGPVQYDPQGRAYQVSNRNEIRPLPNYDKPPKDTGLGNLSAEEVAQKKELKDLISTYEKRFPAPGGGFNPEKAEMNDPEGYKKYQGYLKQHGELSERALQPKTKPATESKKLQVSFDERDKMRALLVQRMSPEQADAYIMQHYEVNPSDSRR